MNNLKMDPYNILKSLLEVTSSHLGKDFLKVMCDELQDLFKADNVFITEAIDFNPTTKVKVLYATRKEVPASFELNDTPCKLVYENKIIQIKKDVRLNFKKASDTTFQSFYGIPIHNKKNACIGHIAIFSDEQREISKELEEIVLIFARRVETEYQRILLEQEKQTILEELYTLTIIDQLTNVYNRRFFNKKCTEIFTQVKRDLIYASLIFLDIDDFKHINDNYGHQEGDYILKELGKVFLDVCRKDIDFISRLGGEEFAIISINTNIADATKLSKRIMEKTNEVFCKKEYSVTFSIGIANFDKKEDSWEKIYSLADHNMYKAKECGKNIIKIHC